MSPLISPQLEKKLPRRAYKKRTTSWNKDITFTEEQKKNMFGHVPWNKGKKWEEMRAEKSPHWRGGVTHNQQGRILVHTKEGAGKYVERSRLVAEKSLERKLKKTEIVHHIDENKANDALENLYVFRHRAAHQKWHWYLRRHNLDGRILESNLVKPL